MILSSLCNGTLPVLIVREFRKSGNNFVVDTLLTNKIQQNIITVEDFIINRVILIQSCEVSKCFAKGYFTVSYKIYVICLNYIHITAYYQRSQDPSLEQLVSSNYKQGSMLLIQISVY